MQLFADDAILEYASPVWDLYLQHDIDNLGLIQRKGARFVRGTFVSDQVLQACYNTWNGNLCPKEEPKQN